MKNYWYRFRQNPLNIAASVVLLFLIFMSIFGGMFNDYDSHVMDVAQRNLEPSAQYWFGTDELGRDLFSRIWIGTRISLLVAVLATVIQLVIGIFYGSIMAFFGGKVDSLMMRVIEIITALPGLLVTMLVMIWFGNNFGALMFAMAITAWCGTARQVRALFLKLLNQDFIVAARMLGTPLPKIIFKHLIPNIMSILILDITVAIPGYVFTEAGLAFLGLGLKEPNTSLGVLISSGQTNMTLQPYQMLFPSLILVLIVFASNLLGDGIRDTVDSKYEVDGGSK
jgi:oligopeptide transport system permease protein